MIKEIPLVPLFEVFIRESFTGKRRKRNGQKFQHGTIEGYKTVLKHLAAFQNYMGKTIRIKTNIRNNTKLVLQERNYWKRFYRDFSNYLFSVANCFDNYVGLNFKTLKTFFRYLCNEKCLLIPHCFEDFYIRNETIRIVTLLPEQFVFLIRNKDFENKLTKAQKHYKDMFVFGTTTAMRYSDLVRLQVKNVELQNGQYFLVYTSKKTGIQVHLKLPSFAIEIFQKHAHRKSPSGLLFTKISAGNFNNRIHNMAKLAGWTEYIGKWRSKDGKQIEQKTIDKKLFRFCDLLSSHTMRRTGITILLMLGLPENLVRKVSGHSPHSKEFYKYVNYAQSYITEELDKAHQKLLSLYKA